MECNMSDLKSLWENCNLTELLQNLSSLSPFDPPSPSSTPPMGKDDAAWILANAFLILTMQTGFGMLEAGTVSSKNIANIMIKNVVDVSIGGLTYWMIGYGISFGKPSNAFCGYGNFFVTASDPESSGSFYAHYVFQFSFATAATTIVSGAVAERMKLEAYMIYSCLNVFIYCIPASWAWNDVGFLRQLLFFDFAGAAVVHLSGGSSALVAALMLGPRLGRFEGKSQPTAMSSPVTALTGTFMLWWAWLAFNCGSSYGINGDLWKIAAKVGVCTLNGSIGGSLVGLVLSVAMTWNKGEYHYDVTTIIESVLGGLIGVTAGCAVFTPAESILIGGIGGLISVLMVSAIEKMGIDDPVGAIPVHFGSAVWSTVCVGLFGKDEFNLLKGYSGILKTGDYRLFGVQVLGTVLISGWSMSITFLILYVLKKTMGIRMNEEEELLGADWVEHRIRPENMTLQFAKAFREISAKRKTEPAQAIMDKVKERLREFETVDVVSRVINFSGPPQPEEDNDEITVDKKQGEEQEMKVVAKNYYVYGPKQKNSAENGNNNGQSGSKGSKEGSVDENDPEIGNGDNRNRKNGNIFLRRNNTVSPS